MLDLDSLKASNETVFTALLRLANIGLVRSRVADITIWRPTLLRTDSPIHRYDARQLL